MGESMPSDPQNLNVKNLLSTKQGNHKSNHEVTATTITATTITVGMEKMSLALKKSYLIFLDETGSMQKLGNAESNEKKGRQIIIEEMNKFIKELKQDGASSESPITIVHFNKQADWRRYEKISDVPVYTKKIYNPGYPTNLYDTLGCVLSTYAESYPNEILKVFVISDGVHQMNSRERRKYGEPVHSKNDVNGIITELKDNNQWEFEFYAVSSPSKKQEMKNQAKNLGFVGREIRAFRFEGKQMGALLKTIRKSIGLKDESAIPVCKKCPKGKKCRKRRKSQIDLGQCSKE